MLKDEIEKDLNKLIEDKVIGENDRDVFRMILALLKLGPDKKKVKEIADFPDFELSWRRLEKNGYFGKGKDRGKILLDYDTGTKNSLIISLLMMALVAKGYAKRVTI